MTEKAIVQFERSGGFAGLSQSFGIKSNELNDQKRREFFELLDKLNALPSTIAKPSHGNDFFKLKFDITYNDQSKHYEYDDMSLPDPLRDLMDFVFDNA
jgi:hypothetical protein